MSTTDYREAAAQLRGLRSTMLAEHALRLPRTWNWRDRFEVWCAVHRTLHIHADLGVPYATTHEVIRQNRAIILSGARDGAQEIEILPRPTYCPRCDGWRVAIRFLATLKGYVCMACGHRWGTTQK